MTRTWTGELRGVYQDAENFPGLVVFRVVDSSGLLRLRVEMAATDLEPGSIAELKGWLDRHDPMTGQLRII